MPPSALNQPLLVSSLIEFAARHHADAEIVSRRVEGDLHRYTYAQAAVRSTATRTTRGSDGSGGQTSSTIWMSAPSNCCVSTAPSGV